MRSTLARLALATAFVLVLAISPAHAADDGPGTGSRVFDAVVLRPLTALSTVAGLAPFVVSVPFLAPTDRLAVSWDLFVAAPYDYTVTRQLGDF